MACHAPGSPQPDPARTAVPEGATHAVTITPAVQRIDNTHCHYRFDHMGRTHEMIVPMHPFAALGCMATLSVADTTMTFVYANGSDDSE